MEIPVGVTCPYCGGANLKLQSQVASHRIEDSDTDEPYLVTFVFECECRKSFIVSVQRDGDDES
jgi:hypothetical protein